MGIGEVIKEKRKSLGLTQEVLAKKIGCATITLRQYENGKRLPNGDVLRQIASALGTEWTNLVPEDLLGSYIAADVIRKAGLTVKKADQVVAEVEQQVETSKIKTDAICSLILLNAQPKTAEKLVDAFLSLNDAGQQKAVERVEELTEIPKYQRQPEEGEQRAVDPQEDN